MAALDWGLLLVLLASLLLGAWRGLIFELLSLAGWVMAWLAAQWWGPAFGAWLPMGEAQAPWRPVAGVVGVFVLAVFACGWLAWLMKRLVDTVGLRPADRALGALFGVVRGLALLLAVTWVLGWTPLPEQPWWQSSHGVGWLQAGLAAVQPLVAQALSAAPL